MVNTHPILILGEFFISALAEGFSLEFENNNPPKVTHEPNSRIISKQLDIKLGPFTLEELDSVPRKIKNRKAIGLDLIPTEVWKTRQFDDTVTQFIIKIDRQTDERIDPPFP